MHIYRSIISAPAFSAQLEEGYRKLDYILYGTPNFSRGSGRPDPTAQFYADIKQKCAFKELNTIDANSGLRYDRTIFAPNIYTALANDLSTSQNADRARRVLAMLETSGRFNQADADKSFADAARLVAAVAQYRWEVAERERRVQAAKDYADQKHRESVAAGISDGLTALSQDIERQIYNSPEAKRARAAMAAQNAARLRLNTTQNSIEANGSMALTMAEGDADLKYGTDRVIEGTSSTANNTSTAQVPDDPVTGLVNRCGMSQAEAEALLAAPKKPGQQGATCN
jgi:outer membrane murein-binding lipoprotein Lpp